MEKWQFPIMSENVEDIDVFLTRKLFISVSFSRARNAQITFAEKPQMERNSSKKQKHGSEKGFLGTVVNRVLPCLYAESLENTFTVF